MARTWADLLVEITAVVEGLRWRQFIVVDYDAVRLGDDAPYAQAACEPAGWYAEISSTQTVPHWPENPQWLAANRWEAPEWGGNWSRQSLNASLVPELLVSGLECGRGCLLVDLFTLRIGRFAMPPDGGQAPAVSSQAA